MTFSELYSELRDKLPGSSSQERTKWARLIAGEKHAIMKLTPLLEEGETTALRFQWLISEIGMHNKAYLRGQLSILYRLSKKIENEPFTRAFASYWRIAGVPVQDEGEAIDQLFNQLSSPTENVTMKWRAMEVLIKLVDKHKELKSELIDVLELQADLNEGNYKTKTLRVLEQLRQTS